MSELVTVRKDSIESRNQLIKDQRYLISQLERIIAERDAEIKALKNFPDAALKVAAEKILLNKNLRKESMKRWKGGDDD